MSLIRPVAILLAIATLFSTAGAAYAAGSRLTPTPPTTLGPGPAEPSPAPQPAVPAQGTAGAIPRTGSDLPRELFVASLLIVVGALLRPRRLTGRT